MSYWSKTVFIIILSLCILFFFQLLYATNGNFFTGENIIILPIIIGFFYYFSHLLLKQQQEENEKAIKYTKQELDAEDWLRQEYAPGILSYIKHHLVKIIVNGSIIFFILYYGWVLFLPDMDRQSMSLLFYVIPIMYISVILYTYIVITQFDILAKTAEEIIKRHKFLRWLLLLNSNQTKIFFLFLPALILGTAIYTLITGERISFLSVIIYFGVTYWVVCSILKLRS